MNKESVVAQSKRHCLNRSGIEAIYVLTQFRRDRLRNLQRTISVIRDTVEVPYFIVASSNYGSSGAGLGQDVIHPDDKRGMLNLTKFLPPAAWDIGDKRHFVYRHAQAQGFDAVSMLDDDIVLSPENLSSHSDLIKDHDIVSSIVDEFPDNSIFFHANRVLNGEHHANPSGSFLTIRTEKTTNAFFNVYNEDWFFFFLNPDARHISSSPLRQLTYDPFEKPLLAAWQEPYDVLGEGIRAIGANAFATAATNLTFWETEISRRRARYEDMLRLGPEQAISECLRAGLARLAEVDERFCVNFCITLRQTIQQNYGIAV